MDFIEYLKEPKKYARELEMYPNSSIGNPSQKQFSDNLQSLVNKLMFYWSHNTSSIGGCSTLSYKWLGLDGLWLGWGLEHLTVLKNTFILPRRDCKDLMLWFKRNKAEEVVNGLPLGFQEVALWRCGQSRMKPRNVTRMHQSAKSPVLKSWSIFSLGFLGS